MSSFSGSKGFESDLTPMGDGRGPIASSRPAEVSRATARTRVLVADDHPLNVELLTVHLERIGYEVIPAHSGQEALEIIDTDRPDVVLLDIMMPRVSGLDVLRRLRTRLATVDLPVILVSGLGETEDIVEGLKLGANDYVTKPINLPILQARLATQTSLKRARDTLKQTAKLLAAELDRNAEDLKVAGYVQRSILPQGPTHAHGLSTAWCYEPATEVGGDLFDVVPLPDGRTFLFLADAMGHGVQAALVVSTVKAALLAQLAKADDLPSLMTWLDMAIGELFEDRFVTAAAAIVDPRSQRMRFVLAGHPPILVLDEGKIQSLRTSGLPLGTRAGFGFEEGEIELGRHARILLFSDGLTEARDSGGVQFGIENLHRAFLDADQHDPTAIILAIRGRLDAFLGQESLQDDMTILVARLT